MLTPVKSIKTNKVFFDAVIVSLKLSEKYLIYVTKSFMSIIQTSNTREKVAKQP